MSADNGTKINKGIDAKDENFKISRKQFIEIIAIGASTIATGCVPITLNTTGEVKGTPTPEGMGGTVVPLDTVIYPEPGKTPQFTQTTTSTQTESSRPSATKTPMEYENKLTSGEFLSKSDEELRNIAPLPEIKKLGFPTHTELTPDVVIRGGEGSNYVLYKRKDSGLQELAWNAETGAVEHAVYGEARTYNVFNKENGKNMEVESIPILIITTNKSYEKDEGWFGPNPDPRYYDPKYNEPGMENPQKRLGEAFTQALGTWYWAECLHRGENPPEQNNRAESLTEIPPIGDFDPKMYSGYPYPYTPYDLTKNQQILLGNYWREIFLTKLEQNQESGEPLKMELRCKRDRILDLTKANVLTVRFDMLKDHPQDGVYWYNTWWKQVQNASIQPTFTFIKGEINSEGNTTLVVDQPAYKTEKNQIGFFGGEVNLFLRFFFGYRWQWFTNNIANDLCPSWSLPASLDENKLVPHGIPLYNYYYRKDPIYTNSSDDQGAIKWIKKSSE